MVEPPGLQSNQSKLMERDNVSSMTIRPSGQGGEMVGTRGKRWDQSTQTNQTVGEGVGRGGGRRRRLPK